MDQAELEDEYMGRLREQVATLEARLRAAEEVVERARFVSDEDDGHKELRAALFAYDEAVKE